MTDPGLNIDPGISPDEGDEIKQPVVIMPSVSPPPIWETPKQPDEE